MRTRANPVPNVTTFPGSFGARKVCEKYLLIGIYSYPPDMTTTTLFVAAMVTTAAAATECRFGVVLEARRELATRRALGTLSRLKEGEAMVAVVSSSSVPKSTFLEVDSWRSGVQHVARCDMVVVATDDDDWTPEAVEAWEFWAEDVDSNVVGLPDRERFGPSRKFGGILVRDAQVLLNSTSLEELEVKCAIDDFEASKRRREWTTTRRRRLNSHHGDAPFRDPYYPQPLSDVTDVTSTTLALAVGYEKIEGRTERAVGLNSRRTITQSQALCLLGGLKVAMLGDSVTRFHYFLTNVFLGTGSLDLFKSSTFGNPPYDYEPDLFEAWTSLSDSDKHRQHFTKNFVVDEPDTCPEKKGMTIEMQFWFLADWKTIGEEALVLYDHVAEWADVAIYNAGFWELKSTRGVEVADPYDAKKVRARYQETVDLALEKVLTKVRAGYFRTSSCCGEVKDEHEDLDEEMRLVQSALGVYMLNDVALGRVALHPGVRVVDGWPFITPRTCNENKGDNENARTSDGAHPVGPIYYVWTQLFLSSLATDERVYPIDPETGFRESDHYFSVTEEAVPTSSPTTPAPVAPTSFPTYSPTIEHCTNGVADVDETDVDCGGLSCLGCGVQQKCLGTEDCTSDLICVDSQCSGAPTSSPTTFPTISPTSPKSVMIPNRDDDDAVGYATGGGEHAIRDESSSVADLGSSHVTPGWRHAFSGSRSVLRGLCNSSDGLRLVLFVAIFILSAFLRLSLTRLIRVRPMAVRTRSNSVAPGQQQEQMAFSLRSATEILGWILLAAFCDARAPAGMIPAGSRILSENPDLWCTIMFALIFGSLLFVRELGDDEVKKTDFLNRAQTNEWKGWMQIAFVAYHLANAQDVYVPIRWFVSAYVWMTGFGNAQYFCKTRDVSLSRFAKMIWRMNFFAAPLSLATGTAWIQYYVVALHSVHFALVYLSYAIVFALSRTRCSKRSSDNNGATTALERWAALVLLAVFVVVIWEVPGVYDATIKPVLLKSFGNGFEEYFWFRTRMDYLSSLSGVACAAIFPQVVKAWSSRHIGASTVTLLSACCFAAVACWIAATRGSNQNDYRLIQPYIATFWVPIYCIARNATPFLRRRVAFPLEWLGARSLELYLLQFHLLMNRSATHILWLIPDENWPGINLILCSALWIVAANRVFHNTSTLREAAESSPITTLSCLTTLGIAYAIMVSINVSCSPRAQPWTLVGILCFGILGSMCADIFACRLANNRRAEYILASNDEDKSFFQHDGSGEEEKASSADEENRYPLTELVPASQEPAPGKKKKFIRPFTKASGPRPSKESSRVTRVETASLPSLGGATEESHSLDARPMQPSGNLV